VVAGIATEDISVFEKISDLTDSKKLSPQKRERIFEELFSLQTSGKIRIVTSIQSVETIDAVGIREANRRAMEEIIATCNSVLPNGGIPAFAGMTIDLEVWIDGADNYVFNFANVEYDFARKKNAKKICFANGGIPGQTRNDDEK
jgi:ribonuclease HII